MIYNEINKDDNDGMDQQEMDSEYIVDTNRYEVSQIKLQRYLDKNVKKLLKSKFVTG